MSISSPRQTAGSVLLLSGGIDSATLLAMEVSRGPVTPLVVDYGQRGAQREAAASQRLCAAHDLKPVHLDLAAVGERFREGLNRRAHVPLPHRNLVILSLAISYAGRDGSSRVALALNREDLTAYASASSSFLERFRTLANTLQPGLEIATPLIDRDKAGVIRLGHELGVDFAVTWSCLLGYETHCGSCPQCRQRREAFRAAELPDPTRYRHNPGTGT
ncbi:7-cyano-7-deazaguanine synthase [Thioalkalivibrio denitrificans]|uniref:7-cyano-7-deazaguanine synthase n=1 Tax=Thioalkalivibrio denitrificans TaxID=108003 RepID=UPI000986B1CB|nr:7-cyano-7-deazaguanine synthase [Thioalkalivibrio denitrificans]